MASRSPTVLTIGHSTHTLDQFLKLLSGAAVTAIADVRTSPFSRHLSHFNREELRESLRHANIAYVFLGKELGGRPRERAHFSDGVADYEKMASARSFQEGLGRVLDGASKYRIALMCAEHNPLDCHRCLLVGRALAEGGTSVKHILADGTAVTHEQIEEELLALSGREEGDLFSSRIERLAVAYRNRSKKVAFAESRSEATNPAAAE